MHYSLNGAEQLSLFDLPAETQDPICPICNEPPRFEPCEMVSGTIWYHIGCKCGLFPRKISNMCGTKEEAVEFWLDPVRREKTW